MSGKETGNEDSRYRIELQSHAVFIMDFAKDVDARGVNCPLPILRTKKALSGMQSGEVLRVVATDPGSVKDFQAFAKQTGNELLSHTQEKSVFTFYLRKR